MPPLANWLLFIYPPSRHSHFSLSSLSADAHTPPFLLPQAHRPPPPAMDAGRDPLEQALPAAMVPSCSRPPPGSSRAGHISGPGTTSPLPLNSDGWCSWRSSMASPPSALPVLRALLARARVLHCRARPGLHRRRPLGT
jgi:hypothetical protein